MSNTMLQFKQTISETNKIRKQEKLVMENFEKSTCELAECFHWILKAALDGKNHCSLTACTCPELYAKELQGMGFEVKKKCRRYHLRIRYYMGLSAKNIIFTKL